MFLHQWKIFLSIARDIISTVGDIELPTKVSLSLVGDHNPNQSYLHTYKRSSAISSDSEPRNPRYKTLNQLLNEIDKLPDYPPSPHISHACMATVGEVLLESHTFTNALSSLDKAHWLEAIRREYESLFTNHGS
jgi:hypothetical protein